MKMRRTEVLALLAALALASLIGVVDAGTNCRKKHDYSEYGSGDPGIELFKGSSYQDGIAGKCRKGSFLLINDSVDDCCYCEKGTYQDDSGNPKSCKLCPAGHYTDSFIRYWYSAANKQISYYFLSQPGSGFGASKCIKCPPGQYNPNDRSGSCLDCPPGQKSSEGATECTPCSKGSFSTGRAADCTPCPAKTYQNLDGQSQCKVCADGTFQTEVGRTGCLLCNAGNFCKNGESTPCLAGTYQSRRGQSQCKICPFGTFQLSTGQTKCIKCPAGSFCRDGKIERCQPGFYCPNGSTKSPFVCPEGQYQPIGGQDKCLQCPARSCAAASASAPSWAGCSFRSPFEMDKAPQSKPGATECNVGEAFVDQHCAANKCDNIEGWERGTKEESGSGNPTSPTPTNGEVNSFWVDTTSSSSSSPKLERVKAFEAGESRIPSCLMQNEEDRFTVPLQQIAPLRTGSLWHQILGGSSRNGLFLTDFVEVRADDSVAAKTHNKTFILEFQAIKPLLGKKKLEFHMDVAVERPAAYEGELIDFNSKVDEYLVLFGVGDRYVSFVMTSRDLKGKTCTSQIHPSAAGGPGSTSNVYLGFRRACFLLPILPKNIPASAQAVARHSNTGVLQVLDRATESCPESHQCFDQTSMFRPLVKVVRAIPKAMNALVRSETCVGLDGELVYENLLSLNGQNYRWANSQLKIDDKCLEAQFPADSTPGVIKTSCKSEEARQNWFVRHGRVLSRANPLYELFLDGESEKIRMLEFGTEFELPKWEGWSKPFYIVAPDWSECLSTTGFKSACTSSRVTPFVLGMNGLLKSDSGLCMESQVDDFGKHTIKWSRGFCTLENFRPVTSLRQWVIGGGFIWARHTDMVFERSSTSTLTSYATTGLNTWTFRTVLGSSPNWCSGAPADDAEGEKKSRRDSYFFTMNLEDCDIRSETLDDVDGTRKDIKSNLQIQNIRVRVTDPSLSLVSINVCNSDNGEDEQKNEKFTGGCDSILRTQTCRPQDMQVFFDRKHQREVRFSWKMGCRESSTFQLTRAQVDQFGEAGEAVAIGAEFKADRDPGDNCPEVRPESALVDDDPASLYSFGSQIEYCIRGVDSTARTRKSCARHLVPWMGRIRGQVSARVADQNDPGVHGVLLSAFLCPAYNDDRDFDKGDTNPVACKSSSKLEIERVTDGKVNQATVSIIPDAHKLMFDLSTSSGKFQLPFSDLEKEEHNKCPPVSPESSWDVRIYLDADKQYSLAWQSTTPLCWMLLNKDTAVSGLQVHVNEHGGNSLDRRFELEHLPSQRWLAQNCRRTCGLTSLYPDLAGSNVCQSFSNLCNFKLPISIHTKNGVLSEDSAYNDRAERIEKLGALVQLDVSDCDPNLQEWAFSNSTSNDGKDEWRCCLSGKGAVPLRFNQCSKIYTACNGESRMSVGQYENGIVAVRIRSRSLSRTIDMSDQYFDLQLSKGNFIKPVFESLPRAMLHVSNFWSGPSWRFAQTRTGADGSFDIPYTSSERGGIYRSVRLFPGLSSELHLPTNIVTVSHHFGDALDSTAAAEPNEEIDEEEVINGEFSELQPALRVFRKPSLEEAGGNLDRLSQFGTASSQGDEPSLIQTSAVYIWDPNVPEFSNGWSLNAAFTLDGSLERQLQIVSTHSRSGPLAGIEVEAVTNRLKVVFNSMGDQTSECISSAPLVPGVKNSIGVHYHDHTVKLSVGNEIICEKNLGAPMVYTQNAHLASFYPFSLSSYSPPTLPTLDLGAPLYSEGGWTIQSKFRLLGVSNVWGSIFQVGDALGNKDLERLPAVWIEKGTSFLHVAVDTTNRMSEACNTDQALTVGEEYVIGVHYKNKLLSVSANAKILCETTLSAPMRHSNGPKPLHVGMSTIFPSAPVEFIGKPEVSVYRLPTSLDFSKSELQNGWTIQTRFAVTGVMKEMTTIATVGDSEKDVVLEFMLKPGTSVIVIRVATTNGIETLEVPDRLQFILGGDYDLGLHYKSSKNTVKVSVGREIILSKTLSAPFKSVQKAMVRTGIQCFGPPSLVSVHQTPTLKKYEEPTYKMVQLQSESFLANGWSIFAEFNVYASPETRGHLISVGYQPTLVRVEAQLDELSVMVLDEPLVISPFPIQVGKENHLAVHFHDNTMIVEINGKEVKRTTKIQIPQILEPLPIRVGMNADHSDFPASYLNMPEVVPYGSPPPRYVDFDNYSSGWTMRTRFKLLGRPTVVGSVCITQVGEKDIDRVPALYFKPDSTELHVFFSTELNDLEECALSRPELFIGTEYYVAVHYDPHTLNVSVSIGDEILCEETLSSKVRDKGRLMIRTGSYNFIEPAPVAFMSEPNFGAYSLPSMRKVNLNDDRYAAGFSMEVKFRLNSVVPEPSMIAQIGDDGPSLSFEAGSTHLHASILTSDGNVETCTGKYALNVGLDFLVSIHYDKTTRSMKLAVDGEVLCEKILKTSAKLGDSASVRTGMSTLTRPADVDIMGDVHFFPIYLTQLPTIDLHPVPFVNGWSVYVEAQLQSAPLEQEANIFGVGELPDNENSEGRFIVSLLMNNKKQLRVRMDSLKGEPSYYTANELFLSESGLHRIGIHYRQGNLKLSVNETFWFEALAEDSISTFSSAVPIHTGLNRYLPGAAVRIENGPTFSAYRVPRRSTVDLTKAPFTSGWTMQTVFQASSEAPLEDLPVVKLDGVFIVYLEARTSLLGLRAEKSDICIGRTRLNIPGTLHTIRLHFKNDRVLLEVDNVVICDKEVSLPFAAGKVSSSIEVSNVREYPDFFSYLYFEPTNTGATEERALRLRSSIDGITLEPHLALYRPNDASTESINWGDPASVLAKMVLVNGDHLESLRTESSKAVKKYRVYTDLSNPLVTGTTTSMKEWVVGPTQPSEHVPALFLDRVVSEQMTDAAGTVHASPAPAELADTSMIIIEAKVGYSFTKGFCGVGEIPLCAYHMDDRNFAKPIQGSCSQTDENGVAKLRVPYGLKVVVEYACRLDEPGCEGSIPATESTDEDGELSRGEEVDSKKGRDIRCVGKGGGSDCPIIDTSSDEDPLVEFRDFSSHRLDIVIGAGSFHFSNPVNKIGLQDLVTGAPGAELDLVSLLKLLNAPQPPLDPALDRTFYPFPHDFLFDFKHDKDENCDIPGRSHSAGKSTNGWFKRRLPRDITGEYSVVISKETPTTGTGIVGDSKISQSGLGKLLDYFSAPLRPVVIKDHTNDDPKRRFVLFEYRSEPIISVKVYKKQETEPVVGPDSCKEQIFLYQKKDDTVESPGARVYFEVREEYGDELFPASVLENLPSKKHISYPFAGKVTVSDNLAWGMEDRLKRSSPGKDLADEMTKFDENCPASNCELTFGPRVIGTTSRPSAAYLVARLAAPELIDPWTKFIQATFVAEPSFPGAPRISTVGDAVHPIILGTVPFRMFQTIKLPEYIPFLILRRPPGDSSVSSYAAESTFSVNVKFSSGFELSSLMEADFSLYVGPQIDLTMVNLPLLGKIADSDAKVQFGSDRHIGMSRPISEYVLNDGDTITLQTSTLFTTASDAGFSGAAGDLFVTPTLTIKVVESFVVAQKEMNLCEVARSTVSQWVALEGDLERALWENEPAIRAVKGDLQALAEKSEWKAGERQQHLASMQELLDRTKLDHISEMDRRDAQKIVSHAKSDMAWNSATVHSMYHILTIRIPQLQSQCHELLTVFHKCNSAKSGDAHDAPLFQYFANGCGQLGIKVGQLREVCGMALTDLDESLAAENIPTNMIEGFDDMSLKSWLIANDIKPEEATSKTNSFLGDLAQRLELVMDGISGWRRSLWFNEHLKQLSEEDKFSVVEMMSSPLDSDISGSAVPPEDLVDLESSSKEMLETLSDKYEGFLSRKGEGKSGAQKALDVIQGTTRGVDKIGVGLLETAKVHLLLNEEAPKGYKDTVSELTKRVQSARENRNEAGVFGFSGGAQVTEYSWTGERTATLELSRGEGSYETSVKMNMKMKLESPVLNGDPAMTLNGPANTDRKITEHTENEHSQSKKQTMSFSLSDASPNDMFDLKITRDPVYGTPVFTTVGGRSTCPHEANTDIQDTFRLTFQERGFKQFDDFSGGGNSGRITAYTDKTGTCAQVNLKLTNQPPTNAFDDPRVLYVQTSSGNDLTGIHTFLDGQPFFSSISLDRTMTGDFDSKLYTLSFCSTDPKVLDFASSRGVYKDIKVVVASKCEFEMNPAKFWKFDDGADAVCENGFAPAGAGRGNQCSEKVEVSFADLDGKHEFVYANEQILRSGVFIECLSFVKCGCGIQSDGVPCPAASPSLIQSGAATLRGTLLDNLKF